MTCIYLFNAPSTKVSGHFLKGSVVNYFSGPYWSLFQPLTSVVVSGKTSHRLYLNEDPNYVPIKLYLQKQMPGSQMYLTDLYIRPLSYRIPGHQRSVKTLMESLPSPQKSTI